MSAEPGQSQRAPWITGVPGPLFQKEVWVAGRRWGTYWVRGLYAVGLLAVATLAFLSSLPGMYVSGAARLQSLQQMAPALTIALMWFQHVALILAAIIFASPGICDEKRAGTLGTLLTTPLKSWQIVVGKLSALSVQLLILALTATPLLLAVRLFGGVTVELVAAGTSLSISSALLAGALALLHSVGAKRAPTAAGVTLFTFLFLQFAGPLLLWACSGSRFRPDPMWYPMSSPPIALGMVSSELVFGSGTLAGVSTLPVWLSAVGLNVVLAGLVVVLASIYLRRAMYEGAAGSTPATAPLPQPDFPLAPGARTRSRRAPVRRVLTSRTVGDAPVLWRELRQAAFAKRWVSWVALGIVLVLATWMYVEVGLDDLADEAASMSIAIIGCVVLMLLALFNSATLIAGERESRTWETLLTTPLAAREIVRGKFWGSLRRQYFIPAVVFGHFVFVCAVTDLPWEIVPFLFVTYAPALAGVTATGVLFSTLIKKSVRAAAANFLVWAGVWAGLPMCVGIVAGGIFGWDDLLEKLMGVVLFLNPVAITGVTADGASGRGPPRYDYFDNFNMITAEYEFFMAAYAGAFALIAWGALHLAARVLAAQTGRRM